MKRFRPISQKITLAILLPLAILLSTTLLFSRWSVSDQVRDRIDHGILNQMNELQLLANSGVNPETGNPFEDHTSLLKTFLSRQIADENESMFGLSEGVVEFRSMGKSSIRPDQDLEFLKIVKATNEPYIGTFDSAYGELRFGVLPITSNDGKSGKLVLVTQVDAELASTNTLFRNLTFGLIALFALTAIVLSFIIRRALRPISQLTLAAQNVSKDNFVHLLEFQERKVDDEISLLGTEFNSMLKRLESSFVEQQRFIDDAGHELRTPLTILKGHLELLQREGITPQSLAIIEDEVNRMSRLVQDLQSLTKATQPNFIQLQSFASDVFIKEVLEKAQSIYANPIELEHYESRQIIGDKQRLTQAMLQLIENAAKYSDANSRIDIGLRVFDSSVVMYVKDTGRGISDEAKDQVFSRFYQVDNTHSAADVGGVGLGLAIVKAIIEGHKGEIAVRNNIPRGSIFEITIPQDARGK